ncbi:MAG TPA: hypothetical protein VEX18_04735 [Polyangiaceae bacterium]|nr:hypothetical protein [Polyangiaceae bacterium]
MLYLSLLFLHFLGLALGVGTNLAMLTLGGAARELQPDERAKFMQRASALRKNGSFGLLLLILSGLGMLIVRGPMEVLRWGGGAFHAKLTLILILIGLFGYMQVLLKKVREAGGGGPLAAKLPKLSVGLLVLNLSIMACAVIAFK